MMVPEELTRAADSGRKLLAMDVNDTPPEHLQSEHRGRYQRKRRHFWKRRQFWISIFAIAVAIVMVLWLISTFGGHRAEVD